MQWPPVLAPVDRFIIIHRQNAPQNE